MGDSASQSEILSFRHILVNEVRAFLREEGMDFEAAADGLGEALVTLSRYREEGTALHPALFLTAELPALLSALGGLEHVPIGAGPRSMETVRRALKQCAPIGRNGWSIYLLRRDSDLSFGVFRCDNFVLSEPPMARLRNMRDRSARILGMQQLAENVLELRTSNGGCRVIYLSGASADTLRTDTLLGCVAGAMTRDIEAPCRDGVRVLLGRVLTEALRAHHGTLLAILPKGQSPRDTFADAIVLEEPLALGALVRRQSMQDTPEGRAAVEGAGHLLSGMLATDGITLVSSAGEILAYNAFLRFSYDERTRTAALGGARRRTFDALSANVGTSLVGAFVRSQDGFVDFKIDERERR